MRDPQRLEQVRKIAILRANALGDFIVTLPALQAIRQAYPTAELVLLGRPWHAGFLQPKRSPIDRVMVVPVYEGIRDEPGEMPDADRTEEFFGTARQEQFDIALGFHGKGVAANPFLQRLGARLTAGLTCPEAQSLDRTVPFYYYQSEVVRYLEVARLIGASAAELEPRMEVLPADREELRKFLGEDYAKPYVVLHPCAVDVRRSWPPQKFALLATELMERGYRVIFSGSLQDQPILENIIDHTEGDARQRRHTCGQLSLGGLAALLAESQLVIASDTGPLHLARAVGAYTVGIYWAPNLINWGPLTRNTHHPVISWEMQCPQCGMVPNDPYPYEPQMAACRHEFSFVRNISVEAVLAQGEALLALRGAESVNRQRSRQDNLILT